MIREQIVRHYLQLAHDRGGGWQMAMFMMANEMERLLEGLSLAHPPKDYPDDPHPHEAGPEQPW